MRRLLALLALVPTLAFGQALQNNVVPTRPLGDNTDAAASTAFVQGTITNQKTYISVVDYCTPTQIASDITACAQNAINAAAAQATVSCCGRLVFFPANQGFYNLLGTLTLPGFVGLIGEGVQSTYIRCANGAVDCVQIGQASGSQTRDQSISNLSIITNAAKTAGAAVHIFNAYRVFIQNTSFESMCRGVDIEKTTNAITIQNTTIQVNQACSDYGIYWHAPTDGSARADVLTLDNVIIDGVSAGVWSGATGIEWDGKANTLVASHLRILHMAKGMCTSCVATGTLANSPAFFNGSDVEMEGFTSVALDMSHGNYSEFKCTVCDISNLTGAVGTTDTNAIKLGTGVVGWQMSSSRVGDSQQAGMTIAGQDVQLDGIQFFATSMAGSGLYPVMDLLTGANGVQMLNIVCGELGGPNNPSYCAQIETTVNSVTFQGDCRNTVNGCVNNVGGTSSLVILPGFDQTGTSTAMKSGGATINVNPYTPTISFPSNIQPLGIQETVTGTCTTGSNNCYYNYLFIPSDNATVGPGTSGTPVSGIGLRVDHHFGGAAMTGNRQTANFRAELTTATGNTGVIATYAALVAAAIADVNDNGTDDTLANSRGQVETVNIITGLAASATHMHAVQGIEIDTNLAAGSSTYAKQGIAIVQFSTDAVAGAGEDAAIVIGNQGGAVGWKNGILFGSSLGAWPFQSTAKAITCSPCGTLDSVLDMSGATITTNFLKSPGFNVTGSGGIFTTSTTAPTIADGQNAIAGVTASPTFSGSSGGYSFLTAGGGYHIAGKGATNDIVVNNKNGTTVLSVPTGTVNVVLNNGNLSGINLFTGAQILTTPILVSGLPTCNAGAKGSRMFVTDQATGIAYHGAVTGGGSNQQGVTCDGSAWYQD